MKVLSKIQINPGNILKHDELISLRGGVTDTTCWRPYPAGGPCYIYTGCVMEHWWCDMLCPGSEWSLCIGY